MRLRQIALVTRDLERAVADVEAVLGLEVGFRDPGVGVFGLRNVVMPVGDTFLEILTPERDGTTAGRFLERRGDGGYMVIVQEPDLDAARKRVADLGVRVVWEATLDGAATLHLHPRDVGAAIVSLDWMDPPESWRWAGPEWQAHVRTDVVRQIAGAVLQAEDWPALARRWSQVMGRPLAGGDTIPLDDGTLRFVPPRDARGPGLAAVELAAADPAEALRAARARGLTVREADGPPEIELCGAVFRLV
jgi:catechol 2,3-dioxygenase-like lactoylglutathione lyase family enzyme